MSRFSDMGYHDSRPAVVFFLLMLRGLVRYHQVDMLGHQHSGVDSGLMTCPDLLQNSLERVFGLRCLKQGETVKATEGEDPLIAMKPR